MENNVNMQQGAAFTEEPSGFNKARVVMWCVRILKRWYLFVISLAVFMTIAYFQNRRWQPMYKSKALMVIQDGRGRGGQFMQGFSLESAYSNVNNQMIMFSSTDFLERVAASNEEFTIDYYTQGRFKQNNYYKRAPFKITRNYVSDNAYGKAFNISDIDGESFRIYTDEDDPVQVSDTCRYGEPYQSSFFFLQVDKTEAFWPGFDMKFRIYTPLQVAQRYSGALALDYMMRGSSVMKATVVGNVPERDCDFLDALTAAFVEENLNRKNDAAVKTIAFIDEQLLNMSDSLMRSEKRLQDFKAQNIDLATIGSSGLYTKYSTLEQDLSEIRLQETYLAYLNNYLEKNINDGAIIAPANLGVSDASLGTLVTKYNEINKKRSEVGEKSPLLARYDSEIEQIKAHMFEGLRNVQVSLDMQKTEINKKMAELEHGLRELPYRQQQFTNIERAFKLNDNYYSFLIQKRADAQIQKASNTSDHMVLEKASVEAVINGGTKSQTYSSYLMLALALPLALIVVVELLNPFVRSEPELMSAAEGSYPLWGTIRHSNLDDSFVVENNPRSALTEAFRVLRTKVEFVVKRKTNITLMVTSTESGDGKTHISLNLSSVFALQGKPTLLIDLDLRKPSITKHLGLKKTKGLSSYLIEDEDVSIDDMIVKDTGKSFDVLPVGFVPPNPGELVKTERMTELIEELKKRYEYIVIDTSPIGLVSDAYSVMNQCDCIVYVARCGKTNRTLLKNTLRQMKSNGINSMGLVFNDVDVNRLEYSSYYGGYGSYYGDKRRNNYYYAAAKKNNASYFDEEGGKRRG